MKTNRKTLLGGGAAVVVIVLFALFRGGVSESISYSTSPVEQGDILQVVDAPEFSWAIIRPEKPRSSIQSKDCDSSNPSEPA